MVGVVLFVLILVFYGFLLSTNLFRKILQEDTNAQVKNFFDKWDAFFKNDSSRLILSITSFVVGVWNFFAPDFGAGFSPTIIGALIPSLLMIVNSVIIYPGILGLINLSQETKDGITKFIGSFEGLAGLLTLVLGLLHVGLFGVPFF